MTFDPRDPLKSPKSMDGTDSGSHSKESIFHNRPNISAEKTPVAEDSITLCAQAAVEKDPKRLLELVSEINRLLDARRKRLSTEGSANGNDGSSEAKPYSRA